MLLKKAKIKSLVKSAKDLNLSEKTIEDIFKKVEELPKNVPFNHVSVASALIYIYSRINKEPRTQREVARVLNTSEVSIGKCTKWIINNFLNKNMVEK